MPKKRVCWFCHGTGTIRWDYTQVIYECPACKPLPLSPVVNASKQEQG